MFVSFLYIKIEAPFLRSDIPTGSTFAAYISYGARPQDLVTSSIMSAPSALCFSKMLYPETEEVKIKKKDIHMVEM